VLRYTYDVVLIQLITSPFFLSPNCFLPELHSIAISNFSGGLTFLGMTQLASTFDLTFVRHWSLAVGLN
jgi:hypothetical protein